MIKNWKSQRWQARALDCPRCPRCRSPALFPPGARRGCRQQAAALGGGACWGSELPAACSPPRRGLVFVHPAVHGRGPPTLPPAPLRDPPPTHPPHPTDAAQLQLQAPPADHRHAAAERPHGALVPHALPHAPGEAPGGSWRRAGGGRGGARRRGAAESALRAAELGARRRALAWLHAAHPTRKGLPHPHPRRTRPGIALPGATHTCHPAPTPPPRHLNPRGFACLLIHTCPSPHPNLRPPQVFASHAQFKDWFSNPLTGMVEGSAEVRKKRKGIGAPR